VTRFLENAVTMGPGLFKERAGAPARAARAFLSLHRSSRPFRFRFELFAMIDDYLRALEPLGVQVPSGYAEALDRAQETRDVIVDVLAVDTPGSKALCVYWFSTPESEETYEEEIKELIQSLQPIVSEEDDSEEDDSEEDDSEEDDSEED